MKKKVIVGVILALIVVLMLVSRMLTSYIFDALMIVLLCIGSWEMSNLLTKMGRDNFRPAVLFYPVFVYGIFLACLLTGAEHYILFVCEVAGFVLYGLFMIIISLMLRDTPRQRTQASKAGESVDKYCLKTSVNTLYAMLYPTLLGIYFIVINHMMSFPAYSIKAQQVGVDMGLVLLLIAFLIPIVCDTCAMFGGMLMKGPKLAPKISPNKTISGFIVGVCMTTAIMAATYFVLRALPATATIFEVYKLNILHFILIGFIGAICSSLGDLLESLIKRKADVKDSGTIFPGHGGVLDRFDSHLVSAFVVFMFFSIILVL